jgi:hypothetical protein
MGTGKGGEGEGTRVKAGKGSGTTGRSRSQGRGGLGRAGSEHRGQRYGRSWELVMPVLFSHSPTEHASTSVEVDSRGWTGGRTVQ